MHPTVCYHEPRANPAIMNENHRLWCRVPMPVGRTRRQDAKMFQRNDAPSQGCSRTQARLRFKGAKTHRASREGMDYIARDARPLGHPPMPHAPLPVPHRAGGCIHVARLCPSVTLTVQRIRSRERPPSPPSQHFPRLCVAPVHEDADRLVHEVCILRLGRLESDTLVTRRDPHDARLCRRSRQKVVGVAGRVHRQTQGARHPANTIPHTR